MYDISVEKTTFHVMNNNFFDSNYAHKVSCCVSATKYFVSNVPGKRTA